MLMYITINVYSITTILPIEVATFIGLCTHIINTHKHCIYVYNIIIYNAYFVDSRKNPMRWRQTIPHDIKKNIKSSIRIIYIYIYSHTHKYTVLLSVHIRLQGSGAVVGCARRKKMLESQYCNNNYYWFNKFLSRVPPPRR